MLVEDLVQLIEDLPNLLEGLVTEACTVAPTSVAVQEAHPRLTTLFCPQTVLEIFCLEPSLKGMNSWTLSSELSIDKMADIMTGSLNPGAHDSLEHAAASWLNEHGDTLTNIRRLANVVDKLHFRKTGVNHVFKARQSKQRLSQIGLNNNLWMCGAGSLREHSLSCVETGPRNMGRSPHPSLLSTHQQSCL